MAGFGGVMEFSDYLLWKAGLMVLAAFVWGVYCGFTGRPMSGRSDITVRPPGAAPRDS